MQIKIDQTGIWTPTYKTWLWKDIQYFSTSIERNGKYSINFLELILNDGINDKKNSLLFRWKIMTNKNGNTRNY